MFLHEGCTYISNLESADSWPEISPASGHRELVALTISAHLLLFFISSPALIFAGVELKAKRQQPLASMAR